MLVLYISLLICLLLFVVLLPKKKRLALKVYKFLRLKPIKKQFLFTKFLLFSNKNAKFYAELNGNFYIIFATNVRVEFNFIMAGTMQFLNANPHFIKGNYSQNDSAYHINTKVHSSYAKVKELNIIIKNCQYKWDGVKNALVLWYNNVKYYVIFNQKLKPLSNTPSKLSFYNLNNIDINYNSFNFKSTNKEEKQKFLQQFFGFYNTKLWQNKKEFYYTFLSKNTLQKNYFLTLKTNSKTITNLYKIADQDYLNTNLNSYYLLLKSNKVKINLTDLGFSDIIDLKVNKQYLSLTDMSTNYKCYLKFSQCIVSAFLGCRFGKLFLYINLKKPCILEYLPFSLNFDTNLFIQNPIKKLIVQNSFNIDVLRCGIKDMTLNSIITKLNNLTILGVEVDVFNILNGLYLNNLPIYTQFLIANLLLSVCVVYNKSLNKDAQKFVLNTLKHANQYKKVEVYCFLSKLITLIKKPSLQDFILEYLNIKHQFLLDNFEYTITNYFGIKVIKNNLIFTKPKTNFKMELCINNNHILLQTGKKDVTFINNITYYGQNQLSLKNGCKNAYIMCSTN